MKITYDEKEDKRHEIVAFIDSDGVLCIKGDTGESIMIAANGAEEGFLDFNEWMYECEVVKTFYRGSGDSVTITF